MRSRQVPAVNNPCKPVPGDRIIRHTGNIGTDLVLIIEDPESVCSQLEAAGLSVQTSFRVFLERSILPQGVCPVPAVHIFQHQGFETFPRRRILRIQHAGQGQLLPGLKVKIVPEFRMEGMCTAVIGAVRHKHGTRTAAGIGVDQLHFVPALIRRSAHIRGNVLRICIVFLKPRVYGSLGIRLSRNLYSAADQFKLVVLVALLRHRGSDYQGRIAEQDRFGLLFLFSGQYLPARFMRDKGFGLPVPIVFRVFDCSVEGHLAAALLFFFRPDLKKTGKQDHCPQHGHSNERKACDQQAFSALFLSLSVVVSLFSAHRVLPLRKFPL